MPLFWAGLVAFSVVWSGARRISAGWQADHASWGCDFTLLIFAALRSRLRGQIGEAALLTNEVQVKLRNEGRRHYYNRAGGSYSHAKQFFGKFRRGDGIPPTVDSLQIHMRSTYLSHSTARIAPHY